MFRTLFSWANRSRRRESSHRKCETSTFRKRSLRLESLENRQLLSVCPNTSDALLSAESSTDSIVIETANVSSSNESSYVESINVNTNSLERPWTCEQNARMDRSGILETLETSSNTMPDSEALTLSQLFESMDDETFSIQASESEVEHGQIEPLVFDSIDGEIPSYSTMSGGSGDGGSGGSGGSGGRSQIYLSGGNAGTCKEGESRIVDIGRNAYSGGTSLPVDFKVNVGGIPELGLDKDYTLVWTSGNVTKTINSYDEDGYISLSFPANASTGTLRINALNDDIYDGDGHAIERGVVTLVPGSNYDVGTTITETEFFIEDRVWANFWICVDCAEGSSSGWTGFGHAYWRMDIPDWSLAYQSINTAYPNIGLYVPTSSNQSYSMTWGYYPTDASVNLIGGTSVDGELRSGGDQTLANADEYHQVLVYSRSLMQNLLVYTDNLEQNPGDYQLYNSNCVVKARGAAAQVGLYVAYTGSGVLTYAPSSLIADIQSYESTHGGVSHNPS